jgi:hypothetical protein
MLSPDQSGQMGSSLKVENAISKEKKHNQPFCSELQKVKPIYE